MKPAAYGALAVVVWTVAVFLVARATVPDRSQEVANWRDRAAVAVERSEQADSARAAAELRNGALIERALVAESRLAQADARSAAASAAVQGRSAELATVATIQDTARVQAAIIVTLQAQILDLSASVGDAREVVRDLRMDLQMVQEDRAADQAEIRQLRATIAAGIEATQPSRGKSRTWQTLALGLGLGVVGWEIVR